ncbi:MAG: hypothetical protein WC668_00170 [Patescibacteria group bacterium]|jgi:hypothetical protein
MTEKNVADEAGRRLKEAEEKSRELEREMARLKVFDQTADLHRRIRERTIDPKSVKKPLQGLIEGRYEDPDADKLPHANERVDSNFTYPRNFRRRSVREQLNFWRRLELTGNLDASHVYELCGNRHLEERELPQKLELDLVVPKFSCLGGYYKAAGELFGLLNKIMPLGRFVEEVKYNGHLRPTARTRGFLGQLDEYLLGDYLVIPVNFGMRWRGASIRYVKERYGESEFGLCHYVMAAALLTHPDLIGQPGCLGINCPGTEYSPGESHERPCDVPLERRIDFCLSASFRSASSCASDSPESQVFCEAYRILIRANFGSAVGFAPAC